MGELRHAGRRHAVRGLRVAQNPLSTTTSDATEGATEGAGHQRTG